MINIYDSDFVIRDYVEVWSALDLDQIEQTWEDFNQKHMINYDELQDILEGMTDGKA